MNELSKSLKGTSLVPDPAVLGAINHSIKFRLVAALKGFPMAMAWEQSQGQSTAGLTEEDLRGLQDLEKNGVPVETRRAANARGAAKAKRPRTERADFRPARSRRFYEGSRSEYYDDGYYEPPPQQPRFNGRGTGPHGAQRRPIPARPPSFTACYKCGQEGHWGRECPNPHPASGSLQQP